MQTPDEFWLWLDGELARREMSYAVLARKAGMHQSLITNSRKGRNQLTLDVCNQIADALGIDQVEILVRAHLVKPPKTKQFDSVVEEMNTIRQALDELDNNDLQALERIGKKARAIREQRERYG